ncbi:MAG: NAD-dependent epimerase/dehydratase family protein, partial [Cellulophaga sp.]
MKILVTGTTGYIGKRLVPLLIEEGHNVVCAVRDKLRAEEWYKNEPLITVVEADFLQESTLSNIPKDID